MKKLKAKYIYLTILAAGLVIVVYYQVSHQSLFWKKPPDPVQSALKESKAGGANPVAYDVPALRIDLLERNSADYDPAGRNLFNYDKPKPTAQELEAIRRAQEEAEKIAAAQRKRMEEEAVKQAEIVQQETEQRAKLPPPPPPAPQANFKFIGYLGNPEDKIAVLEEGKDIYFGKEGETIKELFLIMKVDFDSVVIGYQRPEWQSQTRVLPLGK